jgi:hypothetical protein
MPIGSRSGKIDWMTGDFNERLECAVTIHIMKMEPGKRPKDWKVVKLADSGGNEEFTRQILELRTIVDAGLIFDPEREGVKSAIVSILMDGVMPAFLELEQIRATAGKQIPLMNREQLYHGFAGKLWKAYKHLMPEAAKLTGFDIGFLFCAEKDFQKGLVELRTAYPTIADWFEEFLEATRQDWQNELSRFRNLWVEHQRGERKQFDKFYEPEYAENVFNQAWNAIVVILAAMLETHLPHGTKLIQQAEDDPAPKWGRRFRYQNPLFDGMK